MPQIHYDVKGVVYVYSELYAASLRGLQRAKEQPGDSFHYLMMSMVFSAFTMEAYLNYLGGGR